MIRSRRATLSRGLAALLTTLIALSEPAPTSADSPPGKVSSPWDEMDQEIEATPISPEGRQRALEALAATILLRSPYETTPTPIVVRPPLPKTSNEPPGGSSPPPGGGSNNPPPTTTQAPEPGTLLTGAVGSGLGLLAWVRGRRRRGQEAAPE
jgi:hypothetical protein